MVARVSSDLCFSLSRRTRRALVRRRRVFRDRCAAQVLSNANYRVFVVYMYIVGSSDLRGIRARARCRRRTRLHATTEGRKGERIRTLSNFEHDDDVPATTVQLSSRDMKGTMRREAVTRTRSLSEMYPSYRGRRKIQQCRVCG